MLKKVQESCDDYLDVAYANVVDELEGWADDFDMLVIGTKVLQLAANRLNSDLGNKEIKVEYDKIQSIIKQLDGIIETYK